MAGTLLAAHVAYAAPMSGSQQAELQRLSPQTRRMVQARLNGGDGAQGVINTILLNNLEARYHLQKVEATNWANGTATIQTAGGQSRTVRFDPSTLTVAS
jgi:hypothetical protein